jgi:4-carboxymuconolactone decarboxylase
MARVPDVAPAEMTAEQKRVCQEIAGARSGVVRGPFAIWLRNPDSQTMPISSATHSG